MQGLPESPLGERDQAVLQVIEDEALTSFTFDGLRRKLEAHPETLSRILGRLEEQGVVEKSEDGYTVTDKVRDYGPLRRLNVTEPSVPLLHTLLPYDVGAMGVVSELKGRWFGTLRWLGYSTGDDGMILKWITEDGGTQVDAKFSDRELTIEAKLHGGRDLNDAVRAAHQLVGYIARLYTRLGRSAPIMHYKTFGPSVAS
jgi:DNA-binding transcriptional ArsR family regulator